MTHDPNYVETLTSADQVKRDFVAGKGNGSHTSVLRLLRSGLTVAQVERLIEEEVWEHYLQLKGAYIELWDKGIFINNYYSKCCNYISLSRYIVNSVGGRYARSG